MAVEKTFKEINGKTRVGKFLQEQAPILFNKIMSAAGDLATGDFLGAAKSILLSSKEATAEQREYALKLVEFDIIEQQEITKRWEADAHSDSWLSKNIRPLVLGYLVFTMTIIMILDSIGNNFNVKDNWINLLSSLLITTIGAYFGLREFGKYASKKYK